VANRAQIRSTAFGSNIGAKSNRISLQYFEEKIMAKEIGTYFVKSLWLGEIPRGQLVLKQGISLLTNVSDVG
jgi:hypothetical protein